MKIPATRNDFKQTVQARASIELTKVRTVHEIIIFCSINLAVFILKHVLKKVDKHPKQSGILDY